MASLYHVNVNMLGLKRQVGGVSVQSLHSNLLPRPPQHPWLKSQNSWLSSGVVHATELVSNKDGADLESLKLLCKMARDGIVGGDEDRSVVFGKIQKLSQSFLENSNGISNSCIETVIIEVWNLTKLGVIDVEILSLAKILNYCDGVFVSECEQLLVQLLQSEDDNVTDAVSESLLVRSTSMNRDSVCPPGGGFCTETTYLFCKEWF